jgi:hypothetical protein
MIYKCDTCMFKDKLKHNYERHLKTPKHLINTKEKEKEKTNLENRTCIYCKKIFGKPHDMKRHQISCTAKIEHDMCEKYEKIMNDKIDKLITKYETDNMCDKLISKNRIGRLQQTVITTQKENTYLKSLIDNNNYKIQAMSTFKYVMNTYKDSPELSSLDNYNGIHIGCQNNDEIAELFGKKYRKNNLYIHIGDFIVKQYKCRDAKQQSIWNCDINRCIFMIRELIDDDQIIWQKDLKGIKTRKYIIDPILKYIEEILTNYLRTFNDKFEEVEAIQGQQFTKYRKYQYSTEQILNRLKYNKIHKRILIYISPHFNIDINQKKNI